MSSPRGIPKPPAKKSDVDQKKNETTSPKKSDADQKKSDVDQKKYEQTNVGKAGEDNQETPGDQVVALETDSNPIKTSDKYAREEKNQHEEKDQREGKEVLWELKTSNFVLLLAGLLCGMGLGYVIWVFVRKDLIFWICAALGLLVAKILEETKFPQTLVRIWSAKVTEDMLKPPNDWEAKYKAGSEFYVQSDMYDTDKSYVRSTAVYHNKNTCALTVRERFVRRSRLANELSMASPYGMVIVATISLAISIGSYLNGADAAPNISTAVFCFIVLCPVFFLVGCIIELELRKRRLISFANAQEHVTYIPLHTIGKIERKTYGGDYWKLLYTPPMAQTKLRNLIKILKLILLPFALICKFLWAIVLLTTYNGAFAIWIWHCAATIVLYQAHVKKNVDCVEPTMTLLWITFFVNVFEIWYCAPANKCIDACGKDPTKQLRKLELETETRLPKEKVRRLVVGFCISLALVFISAVAMSSVTNDLFTNVEFFGVDKSWKQSYKEHSKLILCDNENSTSDSNATRRLFEEEDANMILYDVKTMMDISSSSSSNNDLIELEAQTKGQVLRDKYSGDYDAMCRNATYRATSASVAFCTVNWFFLLFLAMYWHRYDKYQTSMKYQDNNIIWHDFTLFYIHSVPSKIVWLGRIIGRHKNETSWFFMLPDDATKLYRYLTTCAPWYANLNPNQPGARELMPM